MATHAKHQDKMHSYKLRIICKYILIVLYFQYIPLGTEHNSIVLSHSLVLLSALHGSPSGKARTCLNNPLSDSIYLSGIFCMKCLEYEGQRFVCKKSHKYIFKSMTLNNIIVNIETVFWIDFKDFSCSIVVDKLFKIPVPRTVLHKTFPSLHTMRANDLLFTISFNG